MANLDFFKRDFDALAIDGCIGDLAGEIAYAYIRVSDEMQAEEGRSGLPRQIENIHRVALEKGYKIPWDLVFADDATGFEFEGRPALTRLRREYKSDQKRASVIVMEHLDRLSRHADWHQGYLLEEMSRNNMLPVFWKPFSSRIERAVMGAIAQDGMELAKARMADGTLKKAKRGRVTAHVAAFGYRFVDPNGQENTVEARKETMYAIDEARAVAIRFMFEGIAYGSMSCYELCNALDERAKTDPRFRPSKSVAWNEKSLVLILRSPLYKGEFVANRWYEERIQKIDEYGNVKTVVNVRQRPEAEWIRVAVPAIVDAETWELANRNLYRNKGFSKRNRKHEYLLTSLLRCAKCGRSYTAMTENKGKRISRYYCSNLFFTRGYREQRECGQRSIHCSVLDAAVWEAITTILLSPEVIVQAIDARYSNEQVEEMRRQIAFLEREQAAKTDEEAKLYQAYLAGAFTPEEYAAERKRVSKTRELLLEEVTQLRSQVLTESEIEDKKATTLELLRIARDQIDLQDTPFPLKQQIVRLLVDSIVLNVNEGWFELTGVIGSKIVQFAKKNYLNDLSSAYIYPRMSAKSVKPSGVA